MERKVAKVLQGRPSVNHEARIVQDAKPQGTRLFDVPRLSQGQTLDTQVLATICVASPGEAALELSFTIRTPLGRPEPILGHSLSLSLIYLGVQDDRAARTSGMNHARGAKPEVAIRHGVTEGDCQAGAACEAASFDDYPYLTADDIRACLEHTAQADHAVLLASYAVYPG